jgi:hypothetical protein
MASDAKLTKCPTCGRTMAYREARFHDHLTCKPPVAEES